ncbi:major histocompatibility complex class I-related gene protein-like isoform X2 [Silurus meridionalis]|uniref:major histocompatibility complex class I-related gene protein-like isoform X2 n=1 Tax=Silurus meridionalis TaxID=175797 RepID=UPI001EEA6BFC|nr:major histocompatibility complex class I-related gene protein-like isoform X2 [Silurus meridionalis]
MKILIFFTFSFLRTSADTHCLEYHYIALTPRHAGSEFTAVGLLDEKQFMFYSSSNKMLIPENWIKNSKSEIYWKNEAQNMKEYQYSFSITFKTIMDLSNHTRAHILQRIYGCKIDDDGTTSGYNQYGYIGEDFIILDLNTGTWIAVNPQAEILKHNWESNDYATYWKNFLEHDCIDWIKTFVTVERKVPPTVSVFQKHSSSPEVVCHATGFFPKVLNITWQKDGEDVLEEVDLRETLPNQDGSFQKRSILKVSAEELQKHTYTCVIEHSSLEKDLVLPVSERRILRDGGSDRGSGRRQIAGVVAVIVVFIAVVALIVAEIVRKQGNPDSRDESDDTYFRQLLFCCCEKYMRTRR